MVQDLFKKIKTLRKENNFSQNYMAKELQMSRPTYAQIEQDQRELTITEAKKLAAIFCISLRDFLAGRKSKYKVVLEQQNKKTFEKRLDLQIRVTKKNLKKFQLQNVHLEIEDVEYY